MKRIFDLLLATVAGIFLLIPVLLVAVLVRLTSKGPESQAEFSVM